MLDERTYPDRRVVEFAEQFVPLKVNIDKQPKTAARYGVSGTPTIMILDSNGVFLGEFFGFHPPSEFVDECKRVLRKRKGK